MSTNRRYTVFISSTLEDLKDHREAVLRGVLEHGHFPLGMEYWGAANDEQWKVIQRQIDMADYYVVVVAHRYGSVHQGISWTEREYNYAIEKGVPVLGFVIAKEAQWKAEHVEKKGAALNRLEAFKRKVESKPVSYWRTSEELKSQVIVALSREIQATPRVGWIRADDALSPETANELARLSSENLSLRTQIAEASGNFLPDVAFEVESAEAKSGLVRRLEKLYRDFYLEVKFRCTLRRGVAVGLTPGLTRMTVRSANEEASVIFDEIGVRGSFSRENGASANRIDITGPTGFRAYGERSMKEWMGGEPRTDLILSITFRPIGYKAGYEVIVPLELKKEHSDGALQWGARALSIE